jgi:mono/diheme cytochrome c family protein/cytochrome c2
MKILVMLIAAAVVAVGGGFLFMRLGIYNIAATEQHTRPVYWLLEHGMKYSVRRRSGAIKVPPLENASMVRQGYALYRQNCEKCHGGPGVASEDFAKGMTPVPLSLVEVARLWRPADLYWTTKYGMKMTGMPAWEFRMTEDQLWAVVAFLNQLRNLSPGDYLAMAQTGEEPGTSRAELPAARKAGDAKRGETALRQYACQSCHIIPGVVGADKITGPPLEGIASRMYIAGALPNTPGNMLRWIRNPKDVDPLTAMPNMNVSEADAVDMLAYLYTLK